MADVLKRILSDSQEAAKVYSGLIEASDVDSKMWDFVDMRKDHEQIVGRIKHMLLQTGAVPDEKPRGNWPEAKKHKSLRVYEDAETLQALLEGERNELQDCEKLMTTGNHRMEHTFVATDVMPVLSTHIDTLDRYLQRAQATGR